MVCSVSGLVECFLVLAFIIYQQLADRVNDYNREKTINVLRKPSL